MRKQILITIFMIVNIYSLASVPNLAPPHPNLEVLTIQKRYLESGAQKRSINRQDTYKRNAGISELKVPVLLIKFPDKSPESKYSKNYYDNLLFSGEPGSMTHYYNEVSYGKIESIGGEVTDWVTSDNKLSFYGGNKTDGYDSKPRELVVEAIEKNSTNIDFSKYDLNDDGYVNSLIVVHSGNGEEVSGNPDDIWSHEWQLSTPFEIDGVKIDRYTMQAINSPVGIFAHEFGHALGLPDIYNTAPDSYSDYPSVVGVYSIMDYGSWAGGGDDFDGTSPSHPMAWEKIYLGWIEPIDLKYWNKPYNINSYENNDKQSVYRIFLNRDENDEYLLIENRQKIGYDSELPGDGILISHIYGKDIDGSSFQQDIDNNEINTQTPKRIRFLEADGDDNIKINRGEATDFFYEGNVNELLSDKDNSPNTCYWDDSIQEYAGDSGIYIRNISSSRSIMSFSFRSLYYGLESPSLNGYMEFLSAYKATNVDLKNNYDLNDDDDIDIEDLIIYKRIIDIDFSDITIW